APQREVLAPERRIDGRGALAQGRHRSGRQAPSPGRPGDEDADRPSRPTRRGGEEARAAGGRLRDAAAIDRRATAVDEGRADDLRADAAAVEREDPDAEEAAGDGPGGDPRRRDVAPEGQLPPRPGRAGARRPPRARPPRRAAG